MRESHGEQRRFLQWRMHVASIICRGTRGYFLREILLSTRIGLSLVSEQWGWSWNRAAG